MQLDFPYIAILGRQPELGLMELECVLGAAAISPFGTQTALAKKPLEIDKLGGSVKVGIVFYDGPTHPLDKLPLDPAHLPLKEGKTAFAVSMYGDRATRASAEAFGLTLKKALRERGSVRLIAPKDGAAVTSAQLKHEKVLHGGFELLIVRAGQRMVLALTTGVQDIDWYNERDYGRPSRSAKVGMLPPKLAQMMVNTTNASMVYDPFCGTGVVLQEALLAGRRAAGSDIEPAMVNSTRENLEWLAGAAPSPIASWHVEEADARGVRLPDMELAIVSEGYLGPNLTSAPASAKLAEIKSELLDLYRASLKNFGRQLESGAEITICVPAWRMGNGWSYLGVIDDLARLGYTSKVLKHVRGPVLYARPGQVVGRQILLLRKK